jgi:protein-S-isoprenylcysteine O-methyltransferase Ste14
MAFVFLVTAWVGLGGNRALAICLLSFWHYYFYWLAYFFGAVRLDIFKRDAITMKAVSLIALGLVYLSFPPDAVSLAVVAAGFLLNSAAARALGSDRTYYGREVAGLPMRQVTAFPYSWISHPMLVGNIAAFGGTMINAGFREHWWPLAAAHVALNLGLLVMETAVEPRRRGADSAKPGAAGTNAPCRSIRIGVCVAAAGALLGGVLASWADDALPGAVIGAGTAIQAFVIFCSYSAPTILAGKSRESQAGGRP